MGSLATIPNGNKTRFLWLVGGILDKLERIFSELSKHLKPFLLQPFVQKHSVLNIKANHLSIKKIILYKEILP